MTDMVLFILLLLFCNQGSRNGFISSAIGPISAFISLHIAFLYFDLSDNIAVAFLLAVGGTIILGVGTAVAFRMWRRTIDKHFRDYIFWPSRLAGAVLSTVWLGGLTIGGLLLFAQIPVEENILKSVQQGLRQSKIAAWTERHVLEQTPVVKNLFLVASVIEDRDRQREIAQSWEFEDLLADPKFQACLQDRQIANQLRDRNVPGLLFNSKIIDLVTDNKSMKHLTLVIKKVYAARPPGTVPEEKPLPPATSQYKTTQISDPADPGPPSGP